MHVKLLQRAGLAFVDMTFRGKLAVLVAIGILLAGETFLVYSTGGVRFVYVHFAYLPILLGGFAFGIIGGVGTGIVAGLLLGPWMPQNTTLDLMQDTHNWMLRWPSLLSSAA